MKVGLISHYETHGGAARACRRLCLAFDGACVSRQLWVRDRTTMDPRVVGSATVLARFYQRVRFRGGQAILRLQRTPNPAAHSVNVVPSRCATALNRSDLDVVNLHWVGGEALSIADAGRIRKPLVLSLHDMWAFCGAEHVTDDGPDARWRKGYSRDNRPAGHGGLDIDRWTWSRKHRHWQPATVVCPSRWLADCVRQSALMQDWPVHVVPNTLDTNVYKPLDGGFARQALNLPEDRSLILFGAFGTDDEPHKGFDLLQAALDDLALDDLGFAEDGVECLVFGRHAPANPPATHIPVRWLGPLHDDASLALLYSAADVMVVPSRMEAFGQTASEAQACGTPVVAFNATGLKDVVAHRETGYLAEPFSPGDLAQGIATVLENPALRVEWGAAARARALRLWSPEVVVPQYLDVYRQAIAFHNERTST